MCEFVFPTKSKLFRKFWILALVFFILSCRTIPKVTYSNIVDSLPLESNIIMKIEVPGNEALLEALMLQLGIESSNFVIGRMEQLAIGLEIDISSKRMQATWVPFHIIAVGNWPMALLGEFLEETWVKSGRNRWRSSADSEIMAISRRELIISSGRLESMLVRARIAAKNLGITPVGISAENADLAFWLLNPDLIHTILPALPVRDFTEAVIVDLVGGVLNKINDDTYSLDMSIHLTDQRYAESLALAMRLNFASQIGETFDFLNYEFLSELDIEARASEVIIRHDSIPIVLLENFLNFDFGLGVGGS